MNHWSSDESDGQPATSSFVSEETFEVEGVVDERVECGQKVYRIRWKGFGPEGDTWEPEDNLSEGCATLLEEYAKSKQWSAQQPAASTESNVHSTALDVFTLKDAASLHIKNEVPERKSRSRSPLVSPGNSTAVATIEAVKDEFDDDAFESVPSTDRQRSKPRKAAGGHGPNAEITAKDNVAPKKNDPKKSPQEEMIAEKPKSLNATDQIPPATTTSSVVQKDPKKSDSSATAKTHGSETAEIAPDKSTTTTDQQPKKRRGRPKKNSAQTPRAEATVGNDQENVRSQTKKRSRTKSAESSEDFEKGALTVAMDDDDSSLEADDASTSNRQRELKVSSNSESNDDHHQRKRRRRTEVDNLYVADRVPDWTEQVLQDGIVGAEETAAGKRVTRRVVQRVKQQTATPSPSTSPKPRSQTTPRRRKRRDENSASAVESVENAESAAPTLRRESDEERVSVGREMTVDHSALKTTNNEGGNRAVVETSADNGEENGPSKEIAVPPVPLESKQTNSGPPNQLSSIPTPVAQDSRDSAQTATDSDQKSTDQIAKPQQPIEEPAAPGRRRPVTDSNLPLPIGFGLDLNTEFKRRMKLYQQDKGQPVRQSAFERACLEGDLTVVRNAVLALKSKQQTLDVNAFDRSGFTLLMRICMTQCSSAHQHEDILEYLVQAGADVNYRHPETGQLPLHLAVNANSLCKVKKLISLKAAINVADRSGITPLMLAAQFNRQHIVFALLEFGADFNADSAPDRRNGERRTALKAAEEAGHSATAGVILNHIWRVKEYFDTARSKVLIDVRVKREISPLHVYGLWESPEFHVFFPFEVTKLPNFRYGFIVVLALAQFSGQQVQVRLWGPSPFNSVLMNEEPLRCLQEDSRFVFLTKLKTGMNCLKIKLDKNARDSQMRMLVQVFLVRLNQLAPPRPPSMPLEAADKI